ncbi:MAG: outer membrane beta-barrel protein [Bacteroidales bacterium]|jgi:hypothetical protein|nr:outer membrane beta-barrel protein [Bacteroidales bacterium]
MKHSKILFAVAFLLCCNFSFAQFYMGIEAGVGGNSTPKSVWTIDAKGGLSVGYLFYAKADSARREGLLLELGVEYANRGLLLVDLNKKSRSDFGYVEMTSRVNFIKVPIVFGVDGFFNGGASFNVFLGFYYSQGLKSSGSLEGFTINEDISAELNDIFKDKKTFTKYEYQPLKSYNVGMRTGAALQTRFNLFVKIAFDIDFIRMQKQLNNPNTYVDLTLGYRFKFRR